MQRFYRKKAILTTVIETATIPEAICNATYIYLKQNEASIQLHVFVMTSGSVGFPYFGQDTSYFSVACTHPYIQFSSHSLQQAMI